jgi:uncharacterized protein (TIGR02996 family)
MRIVMPRRSAARPAGRPEVLGLLRDCKENPDDDTPRLILADRLEEHDDPRGTFLRLQVQAARLSLKDRHRATLVAQANALRQEHEAAWLGPLAKGTLKVFHERGLLSLVVPGQSLTGQNWDKLLADTETWAWVAALYVRERTAPARLAKCRLLAEVSFLQLVHWCCDESGLKLLVASPHLLRLRSLDLAGSGLGWAAASSLAETSSLPRLRRLYLGANSLGDRGLQILAGSPLLARLDLLELASNGIGDVGLQALAVSPHAARLERLDLFQNRIGPDGARALAESPYLTRLRVLQLENNNITDEGVQALARSPNLAKLEFLHLPAGQIGMAGARALVESAHLAGLKELHAGLFLGADEEKVLREGFGERLRRWAPHLRLRPPAEPCFHSDA